MLPKLSLRIILPFAIATAVVVAGLLLYFNRTACIESPECVTGGILIAGGIALLLVALIGWLVAYRTTQPLQEVTAVARRITAGDKAARVLPRRRDEVGELIHAFNQMVEQQREQIDELTSDHQQFSIVLDYMADGVLITDSLGYVDLINPAACRLLGTTQAKAIGRSYAAVVRHHNLIDLWQRCRDTATQQVEAVELGNDLFLQAVVTPFQQHGASGYLVILQDLTQVRRLQVMRRDFVSNLSHELRSPLASLRAVVETLQDGAVKDPPVAMHFLGRAESEIDTMTQMVEELTELSAIESGQIRLRLAPIAVADLFTTPVQRLQTMADGRELTVKVDVIDDLPAVLVDAERVRQVVTNLLHNALKFTAPGGKVYLAAYVNEKQANGAGEVIVEVRDTGIGIPKHDLARIFERFYKIDPARTRGRGGTGLGLAIARHIIQSHGGRLWVKSKEGKGSSFYFTLPVAEEP